MTLSLILSFFQSLGLRYRLGMLFGLMTTFYFGGVSAITIVTPNSIVFYYGEIPELEQLSKFDFAVLEPASGFVPPGPADYKTRWIAYVSVGEVESSRAYYSSIPKSWIVGENVEWRSDIIDQSAPGWPSFFVKHVISPLWKQGYSGFFLDTLDSYQLVFKSEKKQQKNRQGLINVIRAINRHFPDATIILNRGFELLPAVHNQVSGVAFESLFKGWSELTGKYIDVPSKDRAWLMDQVEIVKEKYNLPVIAIDYCPPTDTKCSLDTIQRIRALGLVPYVGDGHLQRINEAASD
ncbi:MAG: endo alpha-1,4 polygalactosaminidase [Burkholderiaceae bacterium]|nr:endo alpha-1,4 polygalactosaminidase [Burkholderiaceae bacterium]